MKPPFRWPSIAATILISFAIGCASPGPPQPPSLHLPQIVNDLTAERLGDTVALHWTTPSRTTDDIDIKGPITAEICREVRPAVSRQTAPHSRGCVPVKRMPVRSGMIEATDALPATLTGDPMGLLLYRVRLFNSNGRTAGPSPAAYSVSGAAPAAVDRLRATSTRSGVMLEWKPEPVAFPVDLDRTLVIVSAPKPAVASKPARPSKPALNLGPPTPAEVHLQAGDPSSDTGGTIDRTTVKGATYRYTAQRVRTVVLAGHTLELRSLPSPAVTVVTRDIFPPAAPTGLAAIPGSGAANRSIDRSIGLSIDLSWEPVSDTDIAGYIVYRQTVTSDGAATAAWKRLNLTPLTGPAFSDRTAVPGKTYLYRVTAIDASGNESAPSAAVQETLTEP